MQEKIVKKTMTMSMINTSKNAIILTIAEQEVEIKHRTKSEKK